MDERGQRLLAGGEPSELPMGRKSNVEAGVAAPSRREVAGRALFAVAIAGSALAIGSVHTVVLCSVTAVLTVSTVLSWWRSTPLEPRVPATLLMFAGIALTSFTALQALPLPVEWIRLLAPYNADVWSRSLGPLSLPGPAWAPLSLDPIATRVELLKGVVYMLAFATAVRTARQREGAGFLAWTVVATGVALAVAAVAHPALGARRVFGLYEPTAGIAPRHIAPLLNPNHLGGYINLAFCLTLGAAFARPSRAPRSLLVILALGLGAVQVWVASRGAVIAMVVGGVATVWVRAAARMPSGRRDRTSLIGAVVTVLSGVVVVLAGSDEARVELSGTNVSKVVLQRMVLHLVRAVPLVGVGRGAFVSTFPHFRDDVGYVEAAFPENIFAQWLSEWGVPVSLVAFAVIAFALRPRAVLSRTDRASGPWAALCALALQNVVDFSSEVPGVVLGGVVCAAIVVGGTSSSPAMPTRAAAAWTAVSNSLWRPTAVVTAALLGAIAAGVTAAFGVDHELTHERIALRHLALDASASRERVLAAARPALLRHPADPYIPYAVSISESRQPGGGVLPWAAAALERAAVYGPAHLALARSFRVRSPAQARLEYRTAMEQDAELTSIAVGEAARTVDGYSAALEVIPTPDKACEVMMELSALVRTRLPATSAALDANVLGRAANGDCPEGRALVPVVTGADEDLGAASAAPWCVNDTPQCRQRALAAADRLRSVAPTNLTTHWLRGRVLVHSGDPARGVHDLLDACDPGELRRECLRHAVELAQLSDDESLITTTLERLSRASCDSTDKCVADFWFVGDVEASRHHFALAVAAYERAVALAPQRDDLVESLAQLTSGPPFEMHGVALELYRRLAAKDPSKWHSAVSREMIAVLYETSRTR